MRLRSLHLRPADDVEKAQAPSASTPRRMSFLPHFSFGSPTLRDPFRSSFPLPSSFPLASSFHLPQRPTTRLVWMTVAASITFILVVCLAFVGGDIEQPYLKHVLDDAAKNDPGLVLIGESVDIDVDEPSITIRWSILGCGSEYMRPGSGGQHGSRMCGLLNEPVHIFVDSDVDPTGTYDPARMPVSSDRGRQLSAQNLYQFDSDHVLDVHDARLYPFDTYFLSGTLRAISPLTNVSIPICRLATVQNMFGFSVETTDVASLVEALTPSETENSPTVLDRLSHDFEMRVARQGDARLYALSLFALGWFMVHVQGLMVYLARKTMDVTGVRVYLAAGVSITVALPQLRSAMPDAPGLDGVLIDAVGYFPQIVLSGTGTAILLLILIVRQSCADSISDVPVRSGSQSPRFTRPPPLHVLGKPNTSSHFHGPTRRVLSIIHLPSEHASSREVAQYECTRIAKHLRGEYVFPPVKIVGDAMGVHKDSGHRRFKTIHTVR